jgi:hypothetical protein
LTTPFAFCRWCTCNAFSSFLSNWSAFHFGPVVLPKYFPRSTKSKTVRVSRPGRQTNLLTRPMMSTKTGQEILLAMNSWSPRSCRLLTDSFWRLRPPSFIRFRAIYTACQDWLILRADVILIRLHIGHHQDVVGHQSNRRPPSVFSSVAGATQEMCFRLARAIPPIGSHRASRCYATIKRRSSS